MYIFFGGKYINRQQQGVQKQKIYFFLFNLFCTFIEIQIPNVKYSLPLLSLVQMLLVRVKTAGNLLSSLLCTLQFSINLRIQLSILLCFLLSCPSTRQFRDSVHVDLHAYIYTCLHRDRLLVIYGRGSVYLQVLHPLKSV